MNLFCSISTGGDALNTLPFLEENNEKIYSVSEITKEIKDLLESSFPFIWVEGEISNFKKHTSGHMYFTLKDEEAQIRCVMWRFINQKLNFMPEDGMKVLVQAELTVYERSGNYQLKVIRMTPSGIGELQMAFEQLKRKLAAEGLFDPVHKKSLPVYPDRIGVVTSPTGAAIRDIVSIIQRRFPQVQIILLPVRVQGEGAAEEIARAIDLFNEYGNVDVIIVGRGGGSLEDLWAFNEEVVARAIFRSKIPVISAVGHEIDFSISDFVADLRAATPSAAAELVVKERREIMQNVHNYYLRLLKAISRVLEFHRERLNNLQKSYGFRKPEDFILQLGQRIDELEERLYLQMRHLFLEKQNEVESFRNRLNALSPLNVLERGYAIVFKKEKVVKNTAELNKGESVIVRLYKGSFDAEVKEKYEE
jgi:exodeoxyribonuclease VII large subunit